MAAAANIVDVHSGFFDVHYFYQTKRARKFTEHRACFDTKKDAYDYCLAVAAKAVKDHVKLHLWIEGRFYQVDVDKAADGWVAFESSSKGIRRIF